MRDYQFVYDNGTIGVYNLSDTQFKAIARAFKEGKPIYVDDKNGLIMKLSYIQSINKLPERVDTNESYNPDVSPEVAKYMEHLAQAEALHSEYLHEDEADYKPGGAF